MTTDHRGLEAMTNLPEFPPRFASKVTVDANGCWLWTATLGGGGYARYMHPQSQRMVAAHRYAYELAKGPIPEGMQLDHLCRIRRCVNPDHVEAVTQRINLLRGDTLTAKAASATHCPSGHEYAGANLYVNPGGERICRQCHRERQAARRLADPAGEREIRRRADAKYRARKRDE